MRKILLVALVLAFCAAPASACHRSYAAVASYAVAPAVIVPSVVVTPAVVVATPAVSAAYVAPAAAVATTTYAAPAVAVPAVSYVAPAVAVTSFVVNPFVFHNYGFGFHRAHFGGRGVANVNVVAGGARRVRVRVR